MSYDLYHSLKVYTKWVERNYNFKMYWYYYIYWYYSFYFFHCNHVKIVDLTSQISLNGQKVITYKGPKFGPKTWRKSTVPRNQRKSSILNESEWNVKYSFVKSYYKSTKNLTTNLTQRNLKSTNVSSIPKPPFYSLSTLR